MSGAVDLSACPRLGRTGKPTPYRAESCHCRPACAVCGYGKHMAVHGPERGAEPGSRPWHHEYVEGSGVPDYTNNPWDWTKRPRQEWPGAPDDGEAR